MQVTKRLFNPGFVSLLTTQFFGAANDNILKQCLTFMVATGIWSGSVEQGGLGQGGQVVPVLCLTLPFILLSGYAGQITDRYSKRSVMLVVKLAELPIAVLAMVGFMQLNLWISLGAMLLLAIQSSFFGPAKFGVIPELVGDEQLSRANGVLNMLTNVAVIAGSLAAGPLSDLFDPQPAESGSSTVLPVRWAPGIALVLVAVCGIVSVWFMPRLKPGNPRLEYDLNPFGTYITSLREMAQGQARLLTVTVAWSAFYMVGMMALMIVPEYEQILDISYTQTSGLLGVLGVAIALGSVSAGVISGHRIRPGLIPLGATGMTASFLLLGSLNPTYTNVAWLVFLAGYSAGFYIVPLQALMQHLSPDDERGQFLGTANAMSFAFSSLGALVFWIATSPLDMPANRVHLICGVLALMGLIVGVVRLNKMASAGEASAVASR